MVYTHSRRSDYRSEDPKNPKAIRDIRRNLYTQLSRSVSEGTKILKEYHVVPESRNPFMADGTFDGFLCEHSIEVYNRLRDTIMVTSQQGQGSRYDEMNSVANALTFLVPANHAAKRWGEKVPDMGLGCPADKDCSLTTGCMTDLGDPNISCQSILARHKVDIGTPADGLDDESRRDLWTAFSRLPARTTSEAERTAFFNLIGMGICTEKLRRSQLAMQARRPR